MGFLNKFIFPKTVFFWKFCKYQFSFLTTAQKMKFSIKDFFNKCDQIRSFLQNWSNLLKKSLMENIIFCAVKVISYFE